MQHYGTPDMGMMDVWAQGGATPMAEMGMDYGMPHAFGAPINHCQQIVSDAIDMAPNLHGRAQDLSHRVQKLERTRGQISKDIADMVAEMKDIARLAGVEPSAALRKALPPQPRQPTFAETTQAAASEDAVGLARKPIRAKTVPAPALAAVPESLEEQTPQSPQPVLSKSKTENFVLPPGLQTQTPVPESLTVTSKDVDGVSVLRVEWRIENVRGKLKECVGRPCVSPTFAAGELPELRLMVEPKHGVEFNSLPAREQKSRHEARLQDGPLSGAVKFKVISTPEHCSKLLIRFNLFVGGVVQGPVEHDFSEHIIHSVDFGNNWLEQLAGGSLTVGVELLSVQKEERGG